MTIDELAARIRAELPKGWEIHVDFSWGHASVLIEDPDGDDVEFWGRHEEDGNGIEATILSALDEAVRSDVDFEEEGNL